jgi:hypothetical protein
MLHMMTKVTDEEHLKELQGLFASMYSAGPPIRLRLVAVGHKMLVSSTTWLPQFRVSNNPAIGIQPSGADIPATGWSNLTPLFQDYFVHSITAEFAHNENIGAADTDTNTKMWCMYLGRAADIQSTSLATAFAAGLTSPNMTMWNAVSFNSGNVNKFTLHHLRVKTPFPYSTNSVGWQATANTTAELFQISVTADFVGETNSDIMGTCRAVYDVSLKIRSASS